MLVGFRGNLTLSYPGFHVLPQLIRQRRWVEALRLSRAAAKAGNPWRSLIATTLGPFAPASLWRLACKIYGRPTDLNGYTALHAERRSWVADRARERDFDFLYRSSTDPIAARLSALFDGENGSYFKGVLAEFGLNLRDPTGDRRVVEYCFRVPAAEFIRDGIPRSLARRAFGSRLPIGIAESHQRGYQTAWWHEKLAQELPSIREEAAIIARCAEAADALDVSWLDSAQDSWPAEADWTGREAQLRCRYGLLRGVSAGHFMRKVTGTN